MKVGFVSLEQLGALDRGIWSSLARSQPLSGPFLDEPWVQSWMDGFRPAGGTLLAAWEGERLIGLAPWMRVREKWNGRTLQVLQSMTNDWSFRWELLVEDGREDALHAMIAWLCRSRAADLIRLDLLPEGSRTLAAAAAVARELGWRSVDTPLFRSPWRPLPRSVQEWDSGLKSKFRSNLRNREQRLRSLGEPSFEVACEGARRAEALSVFYHLESRGWKGMAGSAISQVPEAKRFYDLLMGSDAAAGWVALLRLGARPVAAQLLRSWNRTMFLLKTAYDPELSTFSPGQLLTAELIRYGIREGMERLDFLGEEMVWKSDWTAEAVLHHQITLFDRGLSGRYAYWTRYGWKERLRAFPRVAGLARAWKERMSRR